MAPDCHRQEKMRHSPTIERPEPSGGVTFRILMGDRCWRNREDEGGAIGRDASKCILTRVCEVRTVQEGMTAVLWRPRLRGRHRHSAT